MKKFYLLLRVLLLLFTATTHQTLQAQVSGVVFIDNNGNGTRENNSTYREKGLGGVTIKAYRNDGSLAATAISDAASCGVEGTYSLALGGSDYPVRVEFAVPIPYFETFSQNTSVQFLTTPNSNVNYGVSEPTAYTDVTKGFNVISSVAVRSDYSGAPLSTVKSFGYQQGSNGGTPATTTNHVEDTYGYLRGIGSDKLRKKVYYSQGNKNYMKNGNAPNNPSGKIFQSDFNTPTLSTLTQYLDLKAVGIPIDAFANENKNYIVPDVVNDYNNNISFAWEANYGRVGIGDLDIDAKNEKGYVICMSTQQLISFPLNRAGIDYSRFSSADLLAANTLPNANQIARFDIPYPGDGVNGGAVPANNFSTSYIPNNKDDWFVDGLGIYKGKIYIGVTNPRYYARTGQYSGGNYITYSGADYTIYYTFDPNNGTWTRIMDAYMGDQMPGCPLSGCCRNTAFPFVASDIDFDTYNDELILSFKNLRGDFEVNPNPLVANPQTNAEYGGNNFFIPQMAYRAFPVSNGSTNYRLEYSTGANPGTVDRCGSTYAPPTDPIATNWGNGSNYWKTFAQQYFPNQFINHETYYDAYEGADGHGFIGAAASFPGGNETIFYYADPQNSQSGGINWIANDANALNFRQEMWSGNPSAGYYGKGQGVGDVELIYDVAPIQIGNRVWLDADADGTQDAAETAIANVSIELVNANGTVVGTTTSAANGTYYFNASNVIDTAGNAKLNILGPQPNANYIIRIANTNFTASKGVAGSPLANLFLTVKDAVSTGLSDFSDSDASLNSGIAEISYTTGNYGENSHNTDFGFKAFSCPTIDNPSPAQAICIGTSGSNITVATSQTATDGIKFVRFTSAQTGTNMYTGGMTLTNGTVTPSGGTATYIWTNSDFPNTGTSPIIYYVYALLNPDQGTGCQPAQEVQITVNPLPSFTLVQTNVTCHGAANGKITVVATGGAMPFTYSKDDGATFPSADDTFKDLPPSTYKIAIKDNNGCVKKCN